MGIWATNRDTIGVIIGNIGMILYRKWSYRREKMGVITFMLFIFWGGIGMDMLWGDIFEGDMLWEDILFLLILYGPRIRSL